MTKSHQAFHHDKRSLHVVARALPIPVERLENVPLFQSIADITKRSPPGSFSSSTSTTSASSSPSSTCGPKDNTGQCQKPTNPTTLPIVLGAVIPITAALIIFVILHRRHVKKLRREDANDKHESLDYGMDMGDGPTNKKKKRKDKAGLPAVTVSGLGHDRNPRRGLSMDMGSPYLLAANLRGSRDSIHSLSRSNGDDKYRPATTFIPNDGSSVRSYGQSSRRGADNASTYTASSGPGYGNDGMNENLLRNAQRMSGSVLPAQRNSVIPSYRTPHIQAPDASSGGVQRKISPPNPGPTGLAPASAGPADNSRDSYMSSAADMRRSNNYLAAFIHSRDPSAELLTKSTLQTEAHELPSTNPTISQRTEVQAPLLNPTHHVPANELPPRTQSKEAPVLEEVNENFLDTESDYGDEHDFTASSPGRQSEIPPMNFDRQSLEAPMAVQEDSTTEGLEAPAPGYGPNRLSMGFRPLPPEDPADNPEQRANRIRSFYKEYFDDSKPPPVPQAAYQEDYDQDYLADAPFFDPSTGQFAVAQAPYTQPMARRAMTPPPRAPPRFQPPPRHQSTMSGGHLMRPKPRAFSSQSSQGGPGNRGPPRKPMAPPAPLRILPTPHLLQEDSFALPIDFAPPTSYKDRQAGRPASPLGGKMPYSPMLPAHIPLASSFDDLSAMPSPHALRKSSTFTALDFAPIPRFKNADTASDAGSIRSNRSAMSPAQLHNIRAGAYRVSRIPKEVVGTKTDIAESLKPTWDLRPQGP